MTINISLIGTQSLKEERVDEIEIKINPSPLMGGGKVG
jgi:hypothetical protein